jgi:hypothetical protein
MNRGRIHARAVAMAAALGLLLWATPSHAQFSCDIGSLAGNCTINAPQAVSGDTTVVGDLTITDTGRLDYEGGSAMITVGGDLTVDGEITTKGDNGDNGAGGSNGTSPTAGSNGTPGDDGGDLTIEVGGDVLISATGSIVVNGSKGGNGGKGGNRTGPGTGDGADAGDAADGGDGGTLTFNVCGSFDIESGGELNAKGGNGGKGGTGGNGKGGGDNGAGGASGDGGDGGVIAINVDGQITIAGDVHALGGNGLTGGNGDPNGADGIDGADGSITLSTAQPSVNPAGSDIDPTPTINTDQSPICLQDPLPDGSTTFTQGFYGASPVGEPLVDDIINGAGDPQGLCEEIVGILNDIGITDGEILDDTGPVDCSMSAERDLVALFLTGTVGPGDDDGFLPSGGGGIGNLAAQKITLLLNLNLAAILTGDDIPILSSYFINIDPVQDIVDGVPNGFFDPILTTGGELGTCTDTTPADGVCDGGTVVLTTLGEKVEDLDIAGTTVQEILDAADALLGGGGDPQDVNGVSLSADDLTKILGLINESYDEGNPTGFVTAFDAD